MRDGEFFPSDPQNASMTSMIAGAQAPGTAVKPTAAPQPLAQQASAAVQAQQANESANPSATPKQTPVNRERLLWALHAAAAGQQFPPTDPMYRHVQAGFDPKRPGQFDLRRAMTVHGLVPMGNEVAAYE